MTAHVPSLLEHEYTTSIFSAIFTRENCFRDILFTFPEMEALSKELYSYNIDFALEFEPEQIRGKTQTGRVASRKYLIIHLMVIRYIAMLLNLFSPIYKEEQL